MADDSDVSAFMPLYGRDFFLSTAGWPAEAVGAYIRLMLVSWEQGGLPSAVEELDAISPGAAKHWARLEPKWPEGSDGLRRNARLEAERRKAIALRAARSEAGRKGNATRWGDRKAIANGSQSDRKAIANGIAKTSPPSPSPSPSPNTNSIPVPKEENSHTHTACGDDFRKPGWAADEWERFVAVWNQTGRAARWEPLVAPSAWVDYAASPGWQQRAYAALERLPGCGFFETPLAVTKFFEFVDRILAGEFDRQRQDGRRAKQRTGGNL